MVHTQHGNLLAKPVFKQQSCRTHTAETHGILPLHRQKIKTPVFWAKLCPPSVAGPATHESPAKSRSLAGSESDQIGLGMPDIQWHGDSPLG